MGVVDGMAEDERRHRDGRGLGPADARAVGRDVVEQVGREGRIGTVEETKQRREIVGRLAGQQGCGGRAREDRLGVRRRGLT